MKVPLLDLQAQYESIKEEVNTSVLEVMESQYFIMGKAVENFEQQVRDYCEADFAFGCASGSDALLLALMAIDLQPGDFVITSPFTFFATAGAIHRLGGIPVFIDIEPDSFNIDPQKIRDFLEGKDDLSKRLKPDSEKIKAIIPVHLYGQMADMEPIIKLADEFNLKVIEDAAQSIGATYKGIQAGNYGDFGCFSFFPSKNLGAYGDAGLITVKDEKLAEKVNILRLHGAKPKYHHKYVGINSRLDAIQAAILSVKLKYLDVWSSKRKTIADSYNEFFSAAGIHVSDLSDKVGLVLPVETTGNSQNQGKHIYHQYTIRVNRRDELQEWLKEKGVGTSVYYPVPLHIQECFSELNYSPQDCPVSMQVSQQAISLPIYPELNQDQIEYVVSSIFDFYNN